MSDLLPLLSAAALAGLVGSAHCLGMCGGISGLFAVNAGVASLRAQLPMALTYNAGRVVSYAFLGAVVGLVGSVVVRVSPTVAAGIRLASGILIILIGLRVAFNLRWLNAIERMGSSIWSRIAPVAKGLVPVTTLPRALGLGMLWGWLPCGLVYSVLMIAATSAEPQSGVAVMVAFGIGTMPAMLMTGLGAARLAELTRRRSTRLGLGLLIVLLGVLTIVFPLARLSSGHAAHPM